VLRGPQDWLRESIGMLGASGSLSGDTGVAQSEDQAPNVICQEEMLGDVRAGMIMTIGASGYNGRPDGLLSVRPRLDWTGPLC
jgi:hypothetical protein